MNLHPLSIKALVTVMVAAEFPPGLAKLKRNYYNDFRVNEPHINFYDGIMYSGVGLAFQRS